MWETTSRWGIDEATKPIPQGVCLPEVEPLSYVYVYTHLYIYYYTDMCELDKNKSCAYVYTYIYIYICAIYWI